jgi:succinoglycan biosynthesis transport protein ExoP
MSLSDRPDATMPAWPAPTAQPLAGWDESPTSSAPEKAQAFHAKVLWRALRRWWWQVLLIWIIGSAVLMAPVYKTVKPSYEATAYLEIRPELDGVFDHGASLVDFLRFQKTQAQLVTSPDVLSAALAKNPKLAALPLLRGSDPESVLSKALKVTVVPDTHLISVALASESKDEALLILDSVVAAYLEAANRWANEEVSEQVERLEKKRAETEDIVKQNQDELREKQKQAKGFHEPKAAEAQWKAPLERLAQLQNRQSEIEFKLIEVKTRLASLRRRAQEVRNVRRVNPRDVWLAFLSDPQIIELNREIQRVEDRHAQNKRIAKNQSDVAVSNSGKKLKELKDNRDKLWKEREPFIRQRLEQEMRADGGGDIEQEIIGLEDEERILENEELLVKQQIDEIGTNKSVTEDGALDVEFARTKLARNEKLLEALTSAINKKMFEVQGPAKISKPTKTLVVLSDNRRLKFMIAVPFGVLTVLLAGFVLAEVRAGRVSDPDDVPARTRVEVLGVVPPLPSLRPSRALWGGHDEFRARRQLEEFVQSLDHLRVALCASPRIGDARRCVLITSAYGSEGKTTLAAHLAGRCANAGLSTLLIDADLRNPSLSRLLKVPEGPGLSDVLRGAVEPEGALMVIEAGGGFHLLPAGTLGHDPSRLLQGDRLARLLGQVRQTFDIVIVDTPPVLLVPDALIVGRWTDGAILAVRYDTSRFHLLNRANQRLASVGVPVLGAVVNGVRTMESSYGYYAYSYSSSGDGRSGDKPLIDVPDAPAG